MIMKKKTSDQDTNRFPYERPAMTVISVASENSFCQSEISPFEKAPYLQDYNPSDGEW